MAKIDTREWKEFVLQDIFEIRHPRSRSQSQYENGDVPYVSSGAYNNGIAAYLTPKNGEKLDRGRCITVSPLDGSSYWQEDDFLGRGGSGASISMLYNSNLNQYSALFVCSAIKAVSAKYGYDNLLNSNNLKMLKIKLPVTKENLPDYAYMEEYMRRLEDSVSSSLTALQSAQELEKKKIDVKKWQPFHLYDIFDIDMGNKFDRSKMTQNAPVINFVGRSGQNNGVACEVDLVKDKNGKFICPYKAGDITIAMGGSIGSAFIQEKDFYTSQNVCVLHTDNPKITIHAKRFITTLITASCYNYEAFVEELNKHIKTDFTIYLPAQSDGSPDFLYMDQYAKNVHGGATQVLTKLTRAI